MVDGMLSGVLVFGRIAVNSWANVLQKRMFQRNVCAMTLMVAIWSWMTLVTSAWWCPAVLADLGIDTFDRNGSAKWGWMLAACILEMPGNWLLLRSLQRTDLSIYGPLNCLKPVVSVLLAMIVLSEFPSLVGWVGMLIVLAGTFFLADSNWRSGLASWSALFGHPGVRDRLIAVVLTATASVFLKRSMDGASSWSVLAQWCLLSWLIALVVWSIKNRLILFSWAWLAAKPRDTDRSVSYVSSVECDQPSNSQAVRELDSRLQSLASRILQTELAVLGRSRQVIGIALFLLAMQGLTIILFQRIPVGYALSLFQLGGIVSVFLGNRLFGEAHFRRRLLASIIMLVGATVIVTFGN